jgi:hypothetical protein
VTFYKIIKLVKASFWPGQAKLLEASTTNRYARVAELVDALDLGSSSGDRVGVRVSPLALITIGGFVKSQKTTFYEFIKIY